MTEVGVPPVCRSMCIGRSKRTSYHVEERFTEHGREKGCERSGVRKPVVLVGKRGYEGLGVGVSENRKEG